MLQWMLRSKLQFLIGLCSGFGIALLFLQTDMLHYKYRERKMLLFGERDQVIGLDHDVRKVLLSRQVDDTDLHNDDMSEADSLFKKVRVLCWVMTSPKNFRFKADVVKRTWGRRCNVLLFFSSVSDPLLPAISVDVEEGRKHLTAKTMKAFRYVYDHYLEKAEWFMKCDDDTFVILENLRYFLSTKNSSEPVYYGHHFRKVVKQGYHSGGAGYVLSKEALRRFAARKKGLCRDDGGSEDSELGKCMEKLGVHARSSLDSLGRTRFHCLTPEAHVAGAFPKWYYRFDAGGAVGGIENVSDYAISFHYVTPHKMEALEFFVYHLRPYGMISGPQRLQ